MSTLKATVARQTVTTFDWETWAEDNNVELADISTTIFSTYTEVTVSEDLGEAAGLAAAADLPGTGEVM